MGGGQWEYGMREFQVPSNYKEPKCKEFFSFMRFVCAQKMELHKISTPRRCKVDDIDPISINNEMNVLRAIGSVCQKHLNQFEHSLEYDYQLLDSGKLAMYSNERNTVIMRRG